MNLSSVLADLSLQREERSWLEKTCPYFSPVYLDFLASLRLQPAKEIKIHFEPEPADTDRGQISIEVNGLWSHTILYEVPVMAALSEAYFRTVDTDWSYNGQEGQ